jgi:hypothetical protein
VGIRQYGGNHAVLERESLDCVDDPARHLQLVLRHLLRLFAVVLEVLSGLCASNHNKGLFEPTEISSGQGAGEYKDES